MPIDLGTISFSLAFLSLISLLIVQLRIWDKGKSSFVLIVATLISIVWSVAMLSQIRFDASWFFLIPLIETIKNLAWFILLLSVLGARSLVLSRNKDTPNLNGLLLLTSISLGIPIVLFIYILLLRYWQGILVFFPDYGGQIALFGFLASSVVGLALLEQVIRNTRSHHQWHLKFICLGLGISFSFDLYVYSDALLFSRVNPTLWEIRGVIITAAAPLIGLGIVRTRQQPIQVNISRKLVLHGGVLVATGLYMLLMSAVGFYIRNISGDWGALLRVLFWVISISFLAILMFSGRARNLVRVYISRNLFSSNYDYRDEWTRITQALSNTKSGESLPDRAIQAMADIVGSASGALWLTKDGKHFDQVAQVEFGWIEQEDLNSDDYLISQLNENHQLIDLLEGNDSYDKTQTPQWVSKIKNAWLVIPLELHGKLIGFVLLKKPTVDIRLNWEDYDLLKVVGQQTASYLAQMMASEALSEAQQFTAFNQGSAFVVHDIKTLNSQLSMMVHNAETHKSNPAFVEDMIKTAEHAAKKMDFLLNHFKRGHEAELVDLHQFNLVDLVKEVVLSQGKLKPKPVLECEERTVNILANEAELRSGIGHLIQNAQDATPDDGAVVVILMLRDGVVELVIRDTGSGMSQEFIQSRLFKPFESTKGLTGMGVGVFQSRNYIRKLGGNLVVKSTPGKGTEFKLTIPLRTLKADIS